jgi:tetratricopeptide (TPR) repeat protein
MRACQFAREDEQVSMTQPLGDSESAADMRVRAPRGATGRQNLYAATMLVPLAATLALAGGKMVIRHTDLVADLGSLVQSAQAQQTPRAAGRAPVAGAPVAGPASGVSDAGVAPQVSAAPAAAASSGAGSAAVTVLLEQANYWRTKQQYDQAIDSLKRALLLDPRNADALALTGMIEADRGNRAVAESALNRLRAIAPGDPRIGTIDQSLRVGAIPPEALTDARKLAADNRLSEAVDRYNRVFRGNPPPDRLAVEYYQTLAGTEGGWEQARDGLARVVRQNPQDVRAQLAYAQMLTYRAGARLDGINRLAALSRNPAVAEQATTAWRQALAWLPDDKPSVDPLSVYLAAHPNDAQLANKLEAARNPPVNAADPTATDRIGGFDALKKDQLADAARLFQKSIEANPNDSESVGGLGLVRLRQKNYAEAKTLLARAISLDPEHRNRWEPALTGANQATSAAASGGGSASARAQSLLNSGNFVEAEAELKRQIARNVDNSGGLQSMLADAQAQQGKLGDAEGSYREALARNSRNAGALVGLAGVLSREGRSQEAQTLLAQAESMGAGPQVGQARAAALRLQAQDVRDPATQAALFREAVAADPSNPWLRLDYARSLSKSGHLAEARATMAEVVASARPTTDQLKAAIIFANETSDPDAATQLIQRLPPSERTADMRIIAVQAGIQRDIATALSMSRPMARQRLLEMAAQPDPDGARGPAIARALYRIGEKTAARDALLESRGSSSASNPSAQLAYAGAFLEIGATRDAQQILRRLGSGTALSPAQRQQYAQLQAGLAVRSSDQLNQKGKQADGYDVLAPALENTPDNPALNMALARLYEGAKKPSQALEIDEALLRRDPTNLDARKAAIDAALAAGNRGRADELVQEGLRMSPNDPKAWIASAELNKARGNMARALRDYEHARDLRLQELGYSDNGDDTSTVPAGVSLVPGAPATYAPTSYPRTSYAPPTYPAAPYAQTAPRSLYSPGPRPYGNPNGGADDSTLTAAPPAETPPSSAPPNLYPDNATPASPRPPLAAAQPSAPNYDIRHGRMLDTTANDLPPPAATAASATGAAAAPYSAVYVPNPTVPNPTVAGTPAAVAATPIPPPPSAPAPAPVAPAPSIQAAAPPPSTVPVPLAPAPVTQASAPPPTPPQPAQYQPAQYQPAPYQPAQYQTVQYQPSPAPQYQAPQYQAPPYQPPQYAAPQYARPTYPAPQSPTYGDYAPPSAGGYSNIYQPTVPPDAMYQPQIRGYLPQYQPAPQPAPPPPPRITSPRSSLQVGPFGRPPSVLSDSGNAATGYYNNPFRANPIPAPGDSGDAGPASPGRPDAVTEEIDRNIVSLRDEVAPSLQAGVGFRTRSGDSGLDQLQEFTVPIEAEFSPGGTGRVKITVTPVQLTSGTIAGPVTNLARFGTSALSLVQGTTATNFLATYSGVVPPDQNQQGVGLDAGYTLGNFKADFGTSPLGFKRTNVVGGVEYAPKLTDNLTLRLTGEQRPITDSILSYAGVVDTRTGIKWGGEVFDHGKANFEFSSGLADFYIGAGGGNVRGTHVPDNGEIDVGAGGSYPVYRATGQELRVGLDLVYFGYSKNLGFFTLGQGGYFSPQSYTAALIPVIWRETVDEDLKYEVGISAGFQTYHEKESPYYPEDPQLQAQLEAQQANTKTSIPGLLTSYPAQSKSGFAGSGHASVDYRVAPNLHVGGKLALQHSGNFDEASGLVYARYLFNGTTSQ